MCLAFVIGTNVQDRPRCSAIHDHSDLRAGPKKFSESLRHLLQPRGVTLGEFFRIALFERFAARQWLIPRPRQARVFPEIDAVRFAKCLVAGGRISLECGVEDVFTCDSSDQPVIEPTFLVGVVDAKNVAEKQEISLIGSLPRLRKILAGALCAGSATHSSCASCFRFLLG